MGSVAGITWMTMPSVARIHLMIRTNTTGSSHS
jgi:hypothetical protein